MARMPRFVLPGQPQHVIQRGNNRQPIFAEDEDYRFFLETLGDGAGRHRCDIHAYVLMTNHVHLLLTPHQEPGVARLFQHIGRHYVPYYNRRSNRTGTLWEGRYRATLVDAESYLLACYRYIELNPVRAGMVGRPADYPHSSHRANARGEADDVVAPHPLYRALGADAAARQAAYRGLFHQPIGTDVIDDIRSSTNKGWVLGTDRFRKDIQRLLDRRTSPKPRGGDRKSEAYRNNIHRP
jgi:putative transposase